MMSFSIQCQFLLYCSLLCILVHPVRPDEGSGGAQAVGDRTEEPGAAGKQQEAQLQPVHQVEAALQHFREEVKRQPEDPNVLLNFLQALFLDDRREELAAWQGELLLRFPSEANNSYFHFNYAMTLYGLQRRQEAFAHFVEAICLPDPPRGQLTMHAGSDLRLRSLHHLAILLQDAHRGVDAARAIQTTLRLKRGELKYGSYMVTSLLSARRVSEGVVLHAFFNGNLTLQPPLAQTDASKRGQSVAAFRVEGPAAHLDVWQGILLPFQQLWGEVYGTVAPLALMAPPLARERAVEELERVQGLRGGGEGGCAERRVLSYSFRDAAAGFGAEVHGLVLALNLALHLERTLVMPRRDAWWYTDTDICPQGGLECYFLRLSDCYLEDTLPANRIAYNHTLGMRVRGAVPRRFRSAAPSLLAWRAALTSFLLRPAAALQERLAILKTAVGWSSTASGASGERAGGAVALHIRRGDRMVSRRIVTVEEYLQGVEEMVRRSGARRVLLCSEDWGVVAAVTDAFRSQPLLYDRGETRNSVENSRLLSVSHDLSMHAYALTAIANLLLMAECDFFVGAFHSHFGRLAYELQYGTASLRAPPVILDLPWSSF